jgi:CHASE2 domain-containing sensor protein
MFWQLLTSRKTLFSTMTILALFAAFYFSPGNLEIFDPLQAALSDFEFSDVVVSQFRNDTPMDTNVVIVNVGKNNRAQIAEQIRTLNAFEPKVIGLDVRFTKERTPELDTPLVNALREAKHVVMIATPTKRDMEKDEDDEIGLHFKEIIYSHPKFLGSNVSQGHDKFPKREDSFSATVREIAPHVTVADSLRIVAFGVKVAEQYSPQAAQRFLARGNDVEGINYRGNFNKFLVLDCDQVTPENAAIVRGKIVLMGFMGASLGDSLNMTDKFYTPVSKQVGKSLMDMYGVVIHANIVSTVLGGDYVNFMSDWTALLCGMLLCYIDIALFYYLEEKLPNFFGVVVKIIQFGQAFLLMIASILLFFWFNYNLQSGLMLAVSLLAPDLYDIYEGVVRFIKLKLRNAPRTDLV